MDESFGLDLVALWQSELAAMAADRELREHFVAMLAVWANIAKALAGHDAAGSAAAAQPPRATAAAAASDAGRDAELQLRLAALERRLDALERGGG